jgi:hypothetical protein
MSSYGLKAWSVVLLEISVVTYLIITVLKTACYQILSWVTWNQICLIIHLLKIHICLGCTNGRVLILSYCDPGWTDFTTPDDKWVSNIGGTIIGMGKPKCLENTLPQCHFAHHKSLVDYPGFHGNLSAGGSLSCDTDQYPS